MKIKTHGLWISLCIIGLSSCSINDSAGYDNYSYTTYENTTYMPRSYYTGSDFGSQPASQQVETQVQESYQIAPTSFKDGDRNWVNSQNPRGYTIEVADDEKPAQVAGRLHQLPKTDRTAQIKYERDGKGYYKGIYGSYASEEEAKKALDSLPDSVKSGAAIKDWGSVQGQAQ